MLEELDYTVLNIAVEQAKSTCFRQIGSGEILDVAKLYRL
jgi:hypothetical protein